MKHILLIWIIHNYAQTLANVFIKFPLFPLLLFSSAFLAKHFYPTLFSVNHFDIDVLFSFLMFVLAKNNRLLAVWKTFYLMPQLSGVYLLFTKHLNACNAFGAMLSGWLLIVFNSNLNDFTVYYYSSWDVQHLTLTPINKVVVLQNSVKYVRMLIFDRFLRSLV